MLQNKLRMLLISVMVIGGLMGTLILGACAPAEQEAKQFVVAWTPLGDPYGVGRQKINDGIFEGVEAAGGTVMYGSPSAKGGAAGDPALQAAIMDSFIAAGVDAIIMWPVDVEGSIPSVKKANFAGIPVFPFMTSFPADANIDIMLSEASNNRQGAVEAARVLIEALTKKYGEPRGVVLEVAGVPTASDNIERSGYFHDVIDQYTDIEITTKNTDWGSAEAAIAIEDWFGAHPDTDALYLVTEDAFLPPAIPILDRIGRWKKIGEEGHVIIVGHDAPGVPLYAIKQGYVEYTFDQGFLYASTVFVKVIMEYLQTGIAPQPGDRYATGNPDFPWAEVVTKEGSKGPFLMLEGIFVTIDNYDIPALYGNAFMGEPNGLGPESGAGLWEGD